MADCCTAGAKAEAIAGTEGVDVLDPSSPVVTVYVGNLPPIVDEVALMVPFSYFGSITNIQVPLTRNSMSCSSNSLNIFNFLNMPTCSMLKANHAFWGKAACCLACSWLLYAMLEHSLSTAVLRRSFATKTRCSLADLPLFHMRSPCLQPQRFKT